jgi:hypothetical protein
VRSLDYFFYLRSIIARHTRLTRKQKEKHFRKNLSQMGISIRMKSVRGNGISGKPIMF